MNAADEDLEVNGIRSTSLRDVLTDAMNLKSRKVQKYWGERPVIIDYSQMDQSIIKEFRGSHPKTVKDWLPQDVGLYVADPAYKPTKKQKKHRVMMRLEKLFGVDLSKKHYKLVK